MIPAPHTRKSSVWIASSIGAAVCLTHGSTVQAVTGLITSTDGNKTLYAGENFYAFNHLVYWRVPAAASTALLEFSGSATTSAAINAATPGNYANLHAAGVTVDSNLLPMIQQAIIANGASDKYIAVKFQAGSQLYGWLHLVESGTGINGNYAKIDKWGYNDAGSAIKTLAQSIDTRKLSLSNGQMKLSWASKSEQGVSRYEVQLRTAAGAWAPLASEAPGAGRYHFTTHGTGEFRLVVEKLDGSTDIQNF